MSTDSGATTTLVPVQHIRKTPYTLDVYDIMHRPGEMREVEFDLTVPEALQTTLIGVPKGAPLHVAARLESLHDGILVSADAEATAIGECGRCLIEVREPVQVEIRELFAYSQDRLSNTRCRTTMWILNPSSGMR